MSGCLNTSAADGLVAVVRQAAAPVIAAPFVDDPDGFTVLLRCHSIQRAVRFPLHGRIIHGIGHMHLISLGLA